MSPRAIFPARDAAATRQKLLLSAFLEFYHRGFQGGSLQPIVASAGTSKGALFHHFPGGKQELGYAVVDEVVEVLLADRWLADLSDTDDPITVMQQHFRTFVSADIASGDWRHGCPLNNLAQEMSPIDDGFHNRITRLYDRWRRETALAFERGKAAGSVRRDVSAKSVSAMLVAGQMGVWGTGKASRNPEAMRQASEAVCSYLESLRS
jgi:AcrR family transcriptional regulator